MAILKNENIKDFLNKNNRIYAFGAGYDLSELCDIYPNIINNIYECVDNDEKKWGKKVDIGKKVKIISPDELYKKIQSEDIILISSSYYSDIFKQLNERKELKNIECYSSVLMQQYLDDTVLKKIHETELEILKEFKEICERNNLTYYLIGGTLLGAVRHAGFIPWDDDLDVAMPRKDFESFAKVSYKELDEKYYFHWINTDDTYWGPHAKIRKNKTLFAEKNKRKIKAHKGIYIDIFPLDNIKKTNWRVQDGMSKLLKDLNIAILAKRGVCISYNKNLWLLKLGFSLKQMIKLRNRLMQFLNRKNNKYYVSWGSNYNYIKQTILIERYEPAVKMNFENIECSVPNDYDYILKRIYGEDYMELPPVEKRITHSPIEVSFNTDEEG